MKARYQNTLLAADFPLNIFFTDVTEFPPHWHEAVEMIYVPEGSLKVGVNSEIYTMKSKDILLVSGGDVHYFIPQPRRVNRLILHFDMAYFETAFPGVKNKRFTKALLANCSEHFEKTHRMLEEQIAALMDEYGSQRDAYKIALRARFSDILVILLRYVPMQACTPKERSRRQNRLGRLDSVFRYVEENYGSPITLDEISSVANFSEFYFTRFFKDATGMTFGKYLNNFRVDKAAKLLRTTDDTITEIVFKSGFGSIKTFNRVFKQIKGCSPSIYKRTIYEV